MEAKQKTELEVREEFLKLQNELDNWGKNVDSILNDFVRKTFSAPEHVQIEAKHRIKNIESYCQKALYRGKDYSNPILNIEDKVGTRLVLLTMNDVERLSDFIENEQNWESKKSRDIINEMLENPEIFSYHSNHFIVWPKSTTIPHRELLTCEIQVRTLMQHAYAEVSHNTFYKNYNANTKQAKRHLASSMAFIEAADEKFIQIYDEMNKVTTIQDRVNCLLNNLYKSYQPDYISKNDDIELSTALFSLFSTDELCTIFQKIEKFCENDNKNENYIKTTLNDHKDESLLFSYPISILAFYSINFFQQRTIDRWPFNSESLQSVVQAMGFSSDVI